MSQSLGVGDLRRVAGDATSTSLGLVGATYLNITIHRARVQFSQLGVVDAVGLIERRSSKRQLRLGIGRIELVVLDADPSP